MHRDISSKLQKHYTYREALLQIVGGDKLIIPFADGAAYMNPFKAGIFSVTSFCGPYAGTANTASVP